MNRTVLTSAPTDGSGPEIRNDGAPLGGIIAGGLGGGVRAGAAPEVGVEGGAGGAVGGVAIAPERVETGGSAAGAMGEGAVGVDEVRDHGTLRGELGLFAGDLHPATGGFAGDVGGTIGLGEIIVGHVDLAIDGIHRPGNGFA